MIYIINLPEEFDQCVDWFEVYGTKKDAVERGKEVVEILTEKTGAKWESVYVSAEESEFYEPDTDKKAVLVEQTGSLFHAS